MWSTVKTMMLALALAVTMIAAGCAQLEERTPQQRVAHAAERTADVDSARFDLAVAITGMPGTAGEQTVTGEGVMDFANQRMRMVMDLGSMVPPEERGAMPGDLTMEMIQDGFIVYMRAPMMAGDDRWIRMDPESMGLDAAELQSLQSPMGASGDPSTMLESLGAVADDITEVGQEEVRGTPTTHYRLTVDVEGGLEELTPETRERLQAMSPFGVMTTIPTEVWIDADDRVRRMRQTMELGEGMGPEQPAGATVTTTLEFYDFDGDSQVVLPSEELVDDWADAYGDMGGEHMWGEEDWGFDEDWDAGEGWDDDPLDG